MRISYKSLCIPFFFLITVLAACSKKDTDPKSVLINFIDAVNKQDFKSAKKLITEESESNFDLIALMIQMNLDKTKDFQIDKSKLVLGEPKINGDHAVIKVTYKEIKMPFDMEFKLVSGSWKLDLNPTFEKMGMGILNNIPTLDQQESKADSETYEESDYEKEEAKIRAEMHVADSMREVLKAQGID